MSKMETIWDFKRRKTKKYYGSTKAVMRVCDVEKLLEMYNDFSYLCELHTRTKLVPGNEKHHLKAWSSTSLKFKEKYPLIKEFQ